jgi:hypothetical protein
MGRRHQEEMAVGEDSFMDTIANLVGIMIILVVIVGARGYTTAKVNAQAVADSQLENVEDNTERAESIDRDLESQIEQLQRYEREVAHRSAERMTLVDRVTLANHAIDEHLKGLDESTVEQIAIQEEMNELEKQLEELLKQQGDLPSDQQNVIALQHLPTPMAKTVFGKEIHVMMRNDLVTVIPWDTLIDTLKAQVRTTVARNTQRTKIDDVLGPIDGFMMRYRLLSKSGLMSDGRSAAMGRMIELDKFELEPTADIAAESVPRALATGGRLRMELEANRSQQTTITVWVYPDSFDSFRGLKQQLFADGFLCAARPLPNDMRIGASPRGSTSVAQ